MSQSLPSRSARDLHLVLDFPQSAPLVLNEFQLVRNATDTDVWLIDATGMI